MSSERVALYRLVRLVDYIAYIIVSLLLLRFVLKLFGANPATPFVDFIYSIAGFFLAPFQFIFANSPAPEPGSIIEWSVLVAIIVYWLIALAITKLIVGARPVSRHEAESYLAAEDRDEL
ncbi:MAG: YggT family protein [bacterium]|nr:YggT family protein [bacterium]